MSVQARTGIGLGSGAAAGEEGASVLAAVTSLAPRIREAAATIEAERGIPEDLLHALREAGVFRMARPRAYGGPELDPMTQVRVIEELSAADASVGWCTMIGVVAGYMSAHLESEAAERLFDGDSILAGQVAPRGRAEIVEGGYRVSGHWSFGSASRHATLIMGGCLVRENGATRRDATGAPETRVVLFRPSECEILDTWDTIGLRGTGSHDYVTEDLFVPFEHSFSLFATHRIDAPLYRFPLLFIVNHAGIPLGLARSALEALIELAGTKVMPTRKLLREELQVQDAVARATGAIGAMRSFAYATIEEIWATLRRGETLSDRERALFRSHPIERQMRDVLVACQHLAVQEKTYRPAGRLLLGLDPGDPFF
jgi:indole-3-acetate monooxygenase